MNRVYDFVEGKVMNKIEEAKREMD